MSRIGKQPILIPAGVTVERRGEIVTVTGPRGSLSATLPPKVELNVGDREVRVSVAHPTVKEERALWGTWASHLINMVTGVTNGFTKALEISGVGYKASVSGNTIVLALGFSHPVHYTVPEGIEVTVEKNTITISGNNKELVGKVAAEVRALKPVEPYKGKGIQYVGEVVKRKAGKAAKTVGGGT